MPHFQLRLTREFSEELVVRLSEISAYVQCTDWFVYEHEADEEVSRCHVHVYYFDCKLKEDSFRNAFKSVFPEVEKGDWAMSGTAGRRKGPITLKWSVKYGSKDGRLTVKVCRGFDIKIIHDLEKEFRGIRETAIPAKVVEPRQMTKWKLVELAMIEKEYEEKQRGIKLSKYDTAQLVTKLLIDLKQVFSTHKVIEICETIAAHEGNFNMLDHIVNSLKY